LRLGKNKALEIIGHKSLLQRMVLRLSCFGSDIIIVTADEQALFQSVDYSKLKVVTDIYPNKGSLGGIYSGLVASKSCYNLVVACDMPFLSQDLLRYMIQLAGGFEVVVPRLGNMVEPLCAVYSKGCLAQIERLLSEDNFRVSALFDLVSVKYVEAEEIDHFDPEHLSFFNVNTEADLKKARKLAGGEISYDKR